MSDQRRQSPEERYLQKKLAELAEIEPLLAQRELELHSLRGELLSFEMHYESAVGAKFAELDELRTRIAQLSPSPAVAAAEQIAGNGQAGEGAGPRSQARSRRKQSKADSKPARPAPAKPSSDIQPTRTLKQLYRDIAKALHPDLGDDDASRQHRHEFMARANVAYEAGDEAKLRAVFEDWEHSPESVTGQGAGAELVRVIRKIERAELRLFAIGREIEQLQSSGLFGMKMMSEEAGQFERNLLAEMTARIDADIAVAKEIMARLEHSQPKPQHELQEPPQTPAEPAG